MDVWEHGIPETWENVKLTNCVYGNNLHERDGEENEKEREKDPQEIFENWASQGPESE